MDAEIRTSGFMRLMCCLIFIPFVGTKYVKENGNYFTRNFTQRRKECFARAQRCALAAAQRRDVVSRKDATVEKLRVLFSHAKPLKTLRRCAVA
jgi:hypothetical protein